MIWGMQNHFSTWKRVSLMLIVRLILSAISIHKINEHQQRHLAHRYIELQNGTIQRPPLWLAHHKRTHCHFLCFFVAVDVDRYCLKAWFQGFIANSINKTSTTSIKQKLSQLRAPSTWFAPTVMVGPPSPGDRGSIMMIYHNYHHYCSQVKISLSCRVDTRALPPTVVVGSPH